MKIFELKDMTFRYPGETTDALHRISLTIEEGAFYIICGESGSGKSTLLRQLKTALKPEGKESGSIFYCEEKLKNVSPKKQSSEIGFVFQNPDTQIVTDKVWHELAFGLESIGTEQEVIRLRVAEMASYFGIQNWFSQSVETLSGGQKQLLNLASVMAMHPRVLILDEPTSQLDPIASADFMATIQKLHIEFGLTVIMTAHHLEEVAAYADKVFVLQKGQLIVQGDIAQVGKILAEKHSVMFEAMPTSMQIAGLVQKTEKIEQAARQKLPCTISEGRKWLADKLTNREIENQSEEDDIKDKRNEKRSIRKKVIEFQDVNFRYEKNSANVVENLSFFVEEGEIFALMGGNGTGKTTTLQLMAGILKAQKGKISLLGKKIGSYQKKELYQGILGVLPQDPTVLFVKKTVEEDLYEVVEKNAGQCSESGALRQEYVRDMIALTGISPLMKKHPYDLSGGEQQKVALTKVLLLQPQVLLLDEPTKGLDAYSKKNLGKILVELAKKNITIVLVSHDIDFCAKFATRVGLFFDGNFATIQETKKFFAGNHFYTTAANRMCRSFFPKAVTIEDVVSEYRKGKEVQIVDEIFEGDIEKRAIENYRDDIQVAQNNEKSYFSRMLYVILAECMGIPLCIASGMLFFGDKKYLFISLLIAVLSCIPFFVSFAGRNHTAKKVVLVAVLIAIAVAGRSAFFMVPGIKPMAAVAIVSGISLGAESGFLVGSLSMLVSNMLFGQGPWTPWQMFAMGLVGLFAGLLSHVWKSMKKRSGMCIYGFVTPLIIYGGIMNFASLLMMSYAINRESIFAIYMSGFPMDAVHAVSTVVFLALGGIPMLEKLERVKKKHGIV